MRLVYNARPVASTSYISRSELHYSLIGNLCILNGFVAIRTSALTGGFQLFDSLPKLYGHDFTTVTCYCSTNGTYHYGVIYYIDDTQAGFKTGPITWTVNGTASAEKTVRIMGTYMINSWETQPNYDNWTPLNPYN